MTKIVKTGNTKCCRGYGAPGIFILLVFVKSLSHAQLFCNLMDCSPPGSSLSMGFSRQEYWNGLPFPAPGDLFNSGIKCTCAALQVDSFPLSHQGSPYIASVQFSSVAQSCQTLCDPMNRSTPGLPVHHQLPEFPQTHVHRVGDAIQPSHPLPSPIPPRVRDSSSESTLCMRWPCWSFSTGVSALASFLPKNSQC